VSLIRLAVVDDSVFVRGALRRIFENHRRIEVVGCASTGEELLGRLDEWAPDVITLDLDMPGMGGLATLDRLAEHGKTPVIVLSSCAGSAASITVEAICREAVDFIDKRELSMTDFAAMRRLLADRIEALAAATAPSSVPAPSTPEERIAGNIAEPRVVVIGASTGGPPAIERILRELGVDVPVPIVIAQHMPPGFTAAFAKRLDLILPFRVREAADGDRLAAGTVLIAPGGRNLRVERVAGRIVAAVDGGGKGAVHQPSVDELFTSAARIFGSHALAVILSGMGSDGARGMHELRRRGAYTVAQDEKTSVVYGMPRAAVALGAVRETIALGGIGARIRELLHP
jgi:two-component system, chemotaxis family, protein-glutamate methylesterase/glutaminase